MPLDTFNVATQAPRHPTASWAALAFGLLLAGAGAVYAGVQYRAYQQVQTAQDNAQARQHEASRRERERQRQMNTPAAQERVKMESKLTQMMGTSWAGILDGLETSAYAVEGGVSLVSMNPGKRQAGEQQISLVAIATSPTVMLDYLRALDSVGPVKQVDLVSQQPENAAGPQAIRFRLTVVWSASDAAPGAGS